MAKAIIYQVLPRLFGNTKSLNKPNGSLEENGSGKFNAFDDSVLAHFKEMGITHMWFTGVIEHATGTDYTRDGIVKDNPQVVKGKAGSPYAIKDYYDVDPDLAEDVQNRMGEFEALVNRTHKADLKVIIDFVPNHLARQYQSDSKPDEIDDFGVHDNTEHSFNPQNNFYYLPGQRFIAPVDSDQPWHEEPAKATGNDCFTVNPTINDWYETVKLNYGVDIQGGRVNHFDPLPDTWIKMRSILLFWAEKGVDGFRCDMAEMVPVEFWHWVIKELKSQYPNLVFIAEVYQPTLYKDYILKGGFDWLYDKVGFYDSIIDVMKNEQSLNIIADAWHRIDEIGDNMLFFLENHDEIRLASDFMVGNGQEAWPAWVLTAAYSYNPIMLYNGQEIGEKGMDEEGFSGKDGRTTIFDYWSVDGIKRYVNRIKSQDDVLTEDEEWLFTRYYNLNNLLHQYPALEEGGTYDLMWCNNDKGGLINQRVYALLRFHKHQWILIVSNLSNNDQNCRIIIPEHAFKMIGEDHHQYFRGRELLENARSVQFPKEVAMTSGIGVTIMARQALMYVFT